MVEINRQEAVTFLKSLIQINSVNPPGNELLVVQKIVERAKENGLMTEIRMIDHQRANVLVQLKGKGTKPALIFSGHLDTVPIGEVEWEFGPFSGKEENGNIYGRGAADMKSGVAAMIEAMIILKKLKVEFEGDLIFAGTAGEEVDCCGAVALVDEQFFNRAGAIVISEPSNGEVFISHKGALWLEIVTYGKTAHGAMPEEGTNAILHMYEMIQRLKEYQIPFKEAHALLGEPTMNISLIKGGVQTNVVPDQCKLTIDIRTIPENDHNEIINDIQEIINNLQYQIPSFNAELLVINDRQSISTNANNPLVELALQTNKEIRGFLSEAKGVNYYTDGSVFGPATDLPIIIYGPGDEKIAHQPNEHVNINKFLDATKFYTQMAKNYLEN